MEHNSTIKKDKLETSTANLMKLDIIFLSEVNQIQM